MTKKRKRKLTKLQEKYKDVKDVKAFLRQQGAAQGFYGIKEGSNSKIYIWILIILFFLGILYFTDTSNVDDCAEGILFPNFKLCHCYTEQEIANNPKIYENCFGN